MKTATPKSRKTVVGTATTPVATSNKPEIKVAEKINPSEVKVGNIMAITHYVKVSNANIRSNPPSLEVEGLDEGTDAFLVEGIDLIQNMTSADQFSKEETVTKTRAAELLISCHNKPLTVCFEKADGSERVLRGRLVAPEPLLGRSHCEDLDLPKTDKHRLRLVDHRTIKYIVVDMVKYTVK